MRPDPTRTTEPAPFTALGFAHELYGFRRADGQLMCVRPGHLGRAQLLWLAPEAWWQARCPGTRGRAVDWNDARGLALSLCHRVGLFTLVIAPTGPIDTPRTVRPPTRTGWLRRLAAQLLHRLCPVGTASPGTRS